jgi:hypothetical protein
VEAEAQQVSLAYRYVILGAIMNWLRPMSFNDLTGTIGMGLTIGGSGFTAPIPTSQLLVSTDVPTAAQDGVGRFIFNGAGNNGTSYYGLTAVSDPTTSGARGIGVLASGDYYGLVATNPIGSTPLGAIKSEGNIDVTTGNVTVCKWQHYRKWQRSDALEGSSCRCSSNRCTRRRYVF